MKQVFQYRIESTDQGTLSKVYTDDFSCYCMELPWRENQRGLSCIPSGVYETTVRESPRFGITYLLKGVDGRSFILIHSGNFAGDIRNDYFSHSQGCLLYGEKAGYLLNANKVEQRAVLNSRLTIQKFMRLMGNQPFLLSIYNCYDRETKN